GRRLERLHDDLAVVGDQLVHVDGRHVSMGDQHVGGVPGGRNTVVHLSPSLPHQGDHLGGGVGVLGVDLAACLLLERSDPVELGVVLAALRISGPRDEVELALGLADRAVHLHGSGAFPTGAPRRDQDERAWERQRDGQASHFPPPPGPEGSGPPSLVEPSTERFSCPPPLTRPPLPRTRRASIEDIARFCCVTTSCPPTSRSMTYRVVAPR